MKIIGAEISWNNQWSNDVGLRVIVNKYKNPNYKYKKKGNLYFAYDCKTGFVNYLSYDPKDHAGFGGRLFELQMLNGSIKKLKGPWSSRSEVMNDAGFIPSTEVTVQESKYGLMAGAMDNDRIERIMKKFLPEVKYYIDFDSKRIIIPKNQKPNKEFKSKKVKAEITSSLSSAQHKIVAS